MSDTITEKQMLQEMKDQGYRVKTSNSEDILMLLVPSGRCLTHGSVDMKHSIPELYKSFKAYEERYQKYLEDQKRMEQSMAARKAKVDASIPIVNEVFWNDEESISKPSVKEDDNVKIIGYAFLHYNGEIVLYPHNSVMVVNSFRNFKKFRKAVERASEDVNETSFLFNGTVDGDDNSFLRIMMSKFDQDGDFIIEQVFETQTMENENE